jgi:hypothetical protein
MRTTNSSTKSDCESCQIRDRIPRINGRARGYYTSRNGVRMLIVEPSVNQRMRINGTLEVVVLEIGDGEVRLGIV